MTKPRIHAVLYADHPSGGASAKMIEVMACKVRKKLQVHGLGFDTVWGYGYQMTTAQRAAFDALCLAQARRAA